MNKKSYVEAFTIVEAVVSMALTAIILAIVFVIFTITSERLYDFKKQNEFINDINRITYSLNKSIFNNEQMLLSDNELLLKGFDGQETKYVLSEKFVIMTRNDFTDTFNVSVCKFTIDTLKSVSKKVVYQRLQWKLKMGETDRKMNFYKKIYANELLKLPKDEF